MLVTLDGRLKAGRGDNDRHHLNTN